MSINQSMTDVNRQIVELRALRTELRTLLADWDRRLAATPSGQPAHLLERLADRSAIDRCRVSHLAHPARRPIAAMRAGEVTRIRIHTIQLR